MGQQREPAVSFQGDIPGWVVFAAFMMFGLGGLAFLAALTEFTVGTWVTDTMMGNLIDFLWFGIFDGIVAIAAFYAGYAIFKGNKSGFWLGLIFATLSAIRWFLFIPAVPLASVTMLLIWVLVVYALAHSRAYFYQ